MRFKVILAGCAAAMRLPPPSTRANITRPDVRSDFRRDRPVMADRNLTQNQKGFAVTLKRREPGA
jgi:hypothetical protein